MTETNNIADARYGHDAVDHGITVMLNDPDLARVDRIRLLTDRDFPFYDVSYAYGTLKDGTHVRLDTSDWSFSKAEGPTKGLLRICKMLGVYGKGLHIFDGDVLSICR